MGRKKKNLAHFIQRVFYLVKDGMFIRKPVLMLRALRAVLIHIFTNKDVFWDVNFSITPKCNLSCDHCFADSFYCEESKKVKGELLSTDEIIGVINEALKMGVFNFDFQGGEVFFHKDLDKIINACRPYKSMITIVTNGIMLTDKKAKELKKIGVDQINISIDSGIPEEHDKFRKQKGAFNKAIRAIDNSLRNGLKVTVNTTITKESVYSEGFKKLSEICLQKNVVHYILIGIPVGSWSGKKDVLIGQEERDYLVELNNKYNNMIRRDVDSRLFRTGCPALKEGVYITAFGDVLPCPFTHISLGNLRKYSLKDIVKRGLTFKPLKEHNPLCLIGEDKEFIKKYGYKTYNAKIRPLDGEEIFSLSKNNIVRRKKPLGIKKNND